MMTAKDTHNPHFKINKDTVITEIEKAINFTIDFGGNILKKCDHESLIRNKDEIMNCLRKNLQ